METIKLESSFYRIEKILKKTNAKFFKDLNEGDVIYFSTELIYKKRNGNSLYASYFMVVNADTEAYGVDSQSNISNRLSCFELMEIKQ
jgi:hypothetical protein